MPLADFERVIAINLMAPSMPCAWSRQRCQSVAPLEDGERGTSSAPHRSRPMKARSASLPTRRRKGGVVGLVMPAAREFAQFGIRSTPFAPGNFFHTDAARAAGAGQQSLAASVPFPSLLGRPEQYAALVPPHDREPLSQRRKPSGLTARSAWRRADCIHMLTNTRTTRIEWGDCDPAGIIFYVRYYEIFDVSTAMLIERALGMKKIEYLKAYEFSRSSAAGNPGALPAADPVRR